MVLNKYAVVLLQMALVVVAFLSTALQGGFDETEGVQLGILVAGAIVAYWVPIAKGVWAGLLKTGSSIVIAALTALAPLILEGFIAPEQWMIVKRAHCTA